MKFFALIISILTLFTIGNKTIETSSSSNICGKYIFLRDSVTNPNPQFYEEINLLKNNQFTYKSRRGGFIKIELEGIWKIENNKILLNSFGAQKDSISQIIDCDCHHKRKIYCFDIRDIDNYSFSYNIYFDEEIKRDLFGKTQIVSKGKIDSLQIVTTSGLRSKKFPLHKKSKCYKIFINTRRCFIDEKWSIRKNKLKPLGFDKKPTKYWLYKVD